ncbi:hypothetical protein NDU88_003707 [Pleurodeles waltl]|uniref:Uncharacterized protein n=1 Tax=Pleurodeles waltl TaxID=8319 RepID=A0AAV7MRD1_PLEWA|nr:hypothetical protein NDU88_003707 [Pleurodeles waltl]
MAAEAKVQEVLRLLTEAGRMDLVRAEAAGAPRPARRAASRVAAAVLTCSAPCHAAVSVKTWGSGANRQRWRSCNSRAPARSAVILLNRSPRWEPGIESPQLGRERGLRGSQQHLGDTPDCRERAGRSAGSDLRESLRWRPCGSEPPTRCDRRETGGPAVSEPLCRQCWRMGAARSRKEGDRGRLQRAGHGRGVVTSGSPPGGIGW